ncbi:lactate racemase domain-containing protein [Pseudalkalibacillus caeni]|uniref:DUF2088 domain-containing protein n=1 Tax=Exobacillus caeni TaxID=2574798 RepID=A0A5R9F857_9BACL|nr:lactate racemase domain-containing protein [Pseudalkalibacillus caeni]TLS38430.1 DUF2088 domain-containing protein [Pseudalkalibacillus caeni]
MKFPRVVKIHQHFPDDKIDNIALTVEEQLSKAEIRSTVKPEMRIAITAGSRGISNIAEIIRSTSEELKKLGAKPFVVPAMGSHGGATAEGQKEVLESLGVTEDYCGVPILSSMEVEEIGKTEEGLPVYMDKHAWNADGVIVMGRIKAHTDFKAPIESGLLKMSSIGLGKHAQAQAIHTYGVHGIRDKMPEVGKVVLGSGKVVFGIGIVENAYEETAVIEAIPTEKIIDREQELLSHSKSLMPSLPVKDIDILFVDEIGKNYSGTGMDTNIIGRIRILGVEEPSEPRIKYIIAGDVSEPSHGNALGIGLADLTTERLFRKINHQAMNENVITSTFLDRAKIPIVLSSDSAAIKAAQRANWGVEDEYTRFIRIPNTMDVHHLYISESLIPEVSKLEHVEIVGEPKEMEFDENGDFKRAEGSF